MSEDQFTHLFTYMQAEFDLIHKELGAKATKEQLDKIFNILDGIASRIDVHESEITAVCANVDRLNQSVI